MTATAELPSPPARDTLVAGDAAASDSVPGVRIGLDGTPLIGKLTGIGWYTYCLAGALAEHPAVEQVRLLPLTWQAAAAAVPASSRVALVRRPLPARPMWWCWKHAGLPPLDAFLRADVFHGTNFVAPPSWRIPVVVTVHDLWFVRHPAGVGAAQRALVGVMPSLLRRAAAVITVSEHSRRELLDWLPELAGRTTAVPIAPRPRATASAVPAGLPDPGAPFLLMLGSVNARKNLPAALDALLEVRRGTGAGRLVIAGQVAPPVDLPRALRARGLGPGEVVTLGYVSDGEARWLLEHARLLLSASAHEGFGMPIVEAMAAGLPVVAVAGGAVPEVAGDAAVLVESSDELGGAVSRLLLDEAARAELARRGRIRARGFTWEATAAATLAVYSALR